MGQGIGGSEECKNMCSLTLLLDVQHRHNGVWCACLGHSRGCPPTCLYLGLETVDIDRE
jgi:hypothetical protein